MIFDYPIDSISSQVLDIVGYCICMLICIKDKGLIKLVSVCLAFDLIVFFTHFDSIWLYVLLSGIALAQIYLIGTIKKVQSLYVSIILCATIFVNMATLIGFSLGSTTVYDNYLAITTVLTYLEFVVLGVLGHGSRIARDIAANDPHFRYRRKADTQNMVELSW